jgi:peptidyl-prolyl cis-trans isomerase SurA
LTLALALPALAATTVDRIVAQVNRDVITLSELQARIRTISPDQRAGLSASGGLEKQVLDLMIEQLLLTQDAKRLGIMVSESEVDEALNSIIQNNNMSQAQFKSSLAKRGIDYLGFRGEIKNELLKNKVLGYNVMSKIVITEEEITNFLNGEGASLIGMNTEGGASDFNQVRMIFLGSSPREAGRVMNRAQKIKEEIEAGLSFAEAAEKYSVGPGKDNGGDTGNNLTVGDLQPQLRDLARQVAPGQVSPPINGGQAVLLLYIVPPEPAKAPAPDAKKKKRGKGDEKEFSEAERQAARRQLEQIKLRQKFETWLNNLKSRAVIKIDL